MEGGGVRSETKSRRVIKTPSCILGFRPSSHQAAVTPDCARLRIGYKCWSAAWMCACIMRASIGFLHRWRLLFKPVYTCPLFFSFFFFLLSALQMSAL